VVLLVASGGAAAVALAGHGDHPFAGHGPLGEELANRHFERLAEFLELSESQREQLAALHDAHTQGLAERFERLRAELETVHEMAGSESPDPTAIGERVIAMHREHEALEAAREAFHQEVEALLTPEQVERFAAWRASRPWLDDDSHGFRGRHPH
jgi:Spy/CpxP family protein refolding chaperone